MVERPLIKPEVGVAIPRISKVKDIEFLINFLQKTTEYWNHIQETPSQKNINLLFGDWNISVAKQEVKNFSVAKTFQSPNKRSKASSTVLNYGDVAQMVECSLCIREVRGSMPGISKTRASHQMVITICR